MTLLTALSLASEPCTTHSAIALGNLQAQIDRLGELAEGGCLAARAQVDLVELLLLRGHLLGRIADGERAAGLAEHLVRHSPAEGVTLFARARTLASFHRFTEALTDLQEAAAHGMDGAVVATERAAILQAVGHADQAEVILRGAAAARQDFETLGALAVLRAAQGEVAAAEELFDQARTNYPGVSPLPVALLDFQRGHMWQEQNELPRARRWFEAAIRRVPPFAPAQGHLAEVETRLGHVEVAIDRLRPLAASSDDPAYAAQLARLLGIAGPSEEALAWRARAAARFDELCVRHPEAFAEHAAEFWLAVGDDPSRALDLAQSNAQLRATPRARELFARATIACAAAGLGDRTAPRTRQEDLRWRT